MKTVHIYAPNTYDSKLSSALAYEYFKKYRDDVDKYYAHTIITDTDEITKEVKDDDIVVIIGYSFMAMRSLSYIRQLIGPGHEIIFINNNEIVYDIIMHDDLSIDNGTYDIYLNYKIDDKHSLSYLTYTYFAGLIHSSPITDDMIPENIILLERALTNDARSNQDMLEEYICGLNSNNYSLKNAVRAALNHNGKLDIYQNSEDEIIAIDKFITRTIRSGKIVRQYIINMVEEIERKWAYRFNIYDNLKCSTYNCIAISCPSNYTVVMELLKRHDIVITYRKNQESGLWEYFMFSSDIDLTIDCGYIAKILNGTGTKTRGVFTSKKCIFDKYSWISIDENIFGKPKAVFYK